MVDAAPYDPSSDMQLTHCCGNGITTCDHWLDLNIWSCLKLFPCMLHLVPLTTPKLWVKIFPAKGQKTFIWVVCVLGQRQDEKKFWQYV
jgi:hypothetical protein